MDPTTTTAVNPLLAPAITGGAAFFAVLVGNIVVPWWRGKGEKKRKARYLAIRVVCVLDKYVAACANVSGDTGEPDEDGIYQEQHKTPELPAYPTDVDWHSINYELMYAIQSLPADAERAAHHVSGAAEYDTPPDYEGYYEARREEYANLAVKAFKITDELRRTYSITPLDYGLWQPEEYAQEQIDKLKANKKKRGEVFRKAMEEAEKAGSKNPV